MISVRNGVRDRACQQSAGLKASAAKGAIVENAQTGSSSDLSLVLTPVGRVGTVPRQIHDKFTGHVLFGQHVRCSVRVEYVKLTAPAQ